MKKYTALILSGALMLAIGTAVIIGNGWAASTVFATAINEETPAKIINAGYEEPASITVINDAEYEEPLSTTEIINADQQLETIKINLSEIDEANGTLEITHNPQFGEMNVVIKTLENGEIVLLQYMLDDESEPCVSIVYPSGEVKYLNGDDGIAITKRFDGIEHIPQNIKGDPADSGITEDEAVSIAVNAIVDKYALRQEIVNRYTITAIYYMVYEDFDRAVWWVLLYPTNADDFIEIGCYSANLDGETGEVIQLLSAADGKG